MRKLYTIVRMISYACGLAALILILYGRPAEVNESHWATQAGYMLLLIMFSLFCVSYVIYGIMRR